LCDERVAPGLMQSSVITAWGHEILNGTPFLLSDKRYTIGDLHICGIFEWFAAECQAVEDALTHVWWGDKVVHTCLRMGRHSTRLMLLFYVHYTT